MALAKGIAYLRAQHVDVSRAQMYRWHKELTAAGKPGLFHQPSGPGGRVFIVPVEVKTHIRNRYPADRAGHLARGGAGQSPYDRNIG